MKPPEAMPAVIEFERNEPIGRGWQTWLRKIPRATSGKATTLSRDHRVENGGP